MCSHDTLSSLWLHQLPWVHAGTSANYWSVLVWGGCWLPVFFQRQSNSMNAAHLWVKYNLSLCAGSIHCSGGTGSCLVRCVQCQAGPTQCRETSPSLMFATPSHCGKSTVVRGHDGTGEGDGKQQLLSSCYAPTLVNVYISSFTPQQPWEAGKSWRCPKWLSYS